MRYETRLLSLVCFAIFAVSIAGCGMLSTKNKGEKAQQNDNSLAGEWRAGCNKFDWFGFSYQQEVLKFSVVGDFDKVTSFYSDSTCAEPMGNLSEHGTYAALGSASSAEGARDINFTVTQVSVTADSEDAVKLLNAGSYCGISAWQKGQKTDILGKSCGGMNHPSGEGVFDVYRVDSDGKRLQTGRGSLFTGNRSDANSRPGKLDDTHVYSKK